MDPLHQNDVERLDAALAEVIRQGDDEDEVALLVRLRGDEAPAYARIVTRFGDVATLRTRRDRVADVIANEHVVSAEAVRALRSSDPPYDAEYARLDIAAADAVTRRPPGVRRTGRGSVVCCIDWGIDFAAEDFIWTADPSNPGAPKRSRLLALWDQRTCAENPDHPNRWGYGRIYTQEEINAALQEPDPYKALGYHPADADDRDAGGRWKGAHGTHVLSIAAGNGAGGGPSGVAPDAELIAIHLSRTTPVRSHGNLGDSSTVLEGLDACFEFAGAKPCVVNMSIGAKGGPHDGTTACEAGIDRAVSMRPNRAVTNSAGNYRAHHAHAQGRVAEGETVELPFIVPDGDETDNEIEVFYESSDRISIALVDPDKEQASNVGPGEDNPIVSGGKVVGHVYHHLRHRTGTSGDRHVDIFLRKDATPGEWQLVLHGDRVDDGRFHAWVERDSDVSPHFAKNVSDERSTTGTVCNGLLAITIGAADSRAGGMKLGSFSSFGPTRDGRMKPELVAPGVRICAAQSSPPDEQPESRYVRKSGTSMAAPHVAGAIALMYEAAGVPMEIADTRALLFGSAVRPAQNIEPADIHKFGHGLLDIAAAERAAADWGMRQKKVTTRDDESAGESLDPTNWIAGVDPGQNVLQKVLTQGLANFDVIGRPGEDISHQPYHGGDVLVRQVGGLGAVPVGALLGDSVASEAELASTQEQIEPGRPGRYIETFDAMDSGPRRIYRRITDSYGRLPRGQWIVRRTVRSDEPQPAEVRLTEDARSNEWQSAYRRSRPEDDLQRELVRLLAQRIAAGDADRITARANELRALFGSAEGSAGLRLYGRLTSPEDALGQLYRLELMTQFRESLISDLEQRLNAAAPPAPSRQPPPGPRSPANLPPQPPSQTPPPEIPQPPQPPEPPPEWPPITKPPRWRRAPPGTQVLPRDPGFKDRRMPAWIRRALSGAANLLGITLSGAILVMPFTRLEKALKMAWLALQLRNLTAKQLIGLAGEWAANSVAEWIVQKLGVSNVFDLNRLARNFPGFDLLAENLPISVKTYGVLSNLTGVELEKSLRSRYKNDFLKLVDDSALPERYQRRIALKLLRYRTRLVQEGVWPASFGNDPDIDDIVEWIRDKAVLMVPADHLMLTRKYTGTELWQRHLSGRLSWTDGLGNREAAKKVSNFLAKRILSMGIRSTDLKVLLDVAKRLPQARGTVVRGRPQRSWPGDWGEPPTWTSTMLNSETRHDDAVATA